MTSTVIAHLTDAHLDQQLVAGRDPGAIAYREVVGEHRERLRIVLDDIASRGISDVVFGGDIGTSASNQWFFETLADYPFTLRLVSGNHDTLESVKRFYPGTGAGVPGRLCYSSKIAGRTCLFLDTSANLIDEAQLAWLARELDAATSSVIIFVHHPVLKIDTSLDRGAALHGRSDLEALLNRVPGRVLVFSGHYHMDVQVSAGNITQFITRATSYQIIQRADPVAVDNRSFGYRIVRISDADVTTEVVTFAT